MRSVEAVADFEKAGVRSLTASSEQLEVLLPSPCWRGAAGMACLRGWDRSATIPSMPSRSRGGAPRQH